MQQLLALRDWVDERVPVTKLWNEHLAEYYAPKNFNFWYYFGGLALLVLVIQLLSGIWLTMHYKPSAADAFASVEYIMRDVPGATSFDTCTLRAHQRSLLLYTCTCAAVCCTARIKLLVS